MHTSSHIHGFQKTSMNKANIWMPENNYAFYNKFISIRRLFEHQIQTFLIQFLIRLFFWKV